MVEDDPAISRLIRTTLDTQDYQYHTASNGSEALMEVSAYYPDIVILDLGLPDMDGVEIIKKIRSWSIMPIIVVSARMEDRDKVAALDAGADDYLTKPFNIEEFLARIRAALRRSLSKTENPEGGNLYTNGDLKIDYLGKTVYLKDKEIHLTPIEYKLLCLLAQNTGKVLTHNYIFKKVWGSEQAVDTASLRVFMATVRKKLEKDPSSPQYIQTHIGVGYRMLRQG